MKRILLSLFSIGILAFGVYGATRAYFSDTEVSTGNTFSTGTLDLTVDALNNTNVVKFNVSDIVPGSNGDGYWTVKNVGSVDGYLDIESISVSSAEGTNPESETNTTDPGDLSTNMSITLFVDENSNGAYDAGSDLLINSGYLSGISSVNLNYPMPAGTEKRIQLDWDVPTTTSNDIQGDTANLGMTFELAQTEAQ